MSDYHDYSLIRLSDHDHNAIVEHICNLSKDDTYLRFRYAAKEDNIANYVNSTIRETNYQDNFWWGIHDVEKLIATIHVAIKDDIAEFAFTTDAAYRGQKLGQLLFARGYQLICERKITKIYLSMLSKNRAMIHIAKKFGMNVMIQGPDAEASIIIECPVPLRRFNEVRYSLIDSELFKE